LTRHKSIDILIKISNKRTFVFPTFKVERYRTRVSYWKLWM